MEHFLKNAAGIFTPEQVRMMQEEMDKTTPPAETEEQRRMRALSIIRNAELKRSRSGDGHRDRPRQAGHP